jgi:hypothetical protein
MALRRSMRSVSRQRPSINPMRSRVPTTRKPHFRWRAMLDAFSGKILAWRVQMPFASEESTSARNSADPTPHPPGAPGYVDADFGHSGVHCTRGDRAQSCPTEDLASRPGNPAAGSQVSRVPLLPIGIRLLEGGVSGLAAFAVDLANGLPIVRRHGCEFDQHSPSLGAMLLTLGRGHAAA